MPEVSSYAPGAPCWVDLATADPADARRFYGSLFGWSFAIGPPETGNYTMCQLDGRTVAGMVGQPVETIPTSWTTYLATDDADAAAERVGDAGGSVMRGPMDVLREGRLVLATDPTGALFGLWEGRNLVGAGLVGEPGALAWNELATRDLDAAQRFYTAVCGYDWQTTDTGAGGPAYRTFLVDGRPAGGVLDMPGIGPAEAAPHWMPYFVVADTDAAVASVTGLGGTVRSGPTDSPYGRLVTVSDPQGGVLTLTTPPGQAA